MNGLILIEGNKSTFKGTIAGHIKDHFNCEVEKGIPKGENSLLKNYKTVEEAQAFLFSFWLKKIEIGYSRLIIFDRTYITPITYNEAFGDENRQFVYISDTQRIEIENMILTLPYALIYLHDTVDNLWHRYINRAYHEIEKTDYINSRDEIKLLNYRYDNYFHNITLLEYLDVNCQKINPQNPDTIEKYILNRLLT